VPDIEKHVSAFLGCDVAAATAPRYSLLATTASATDAVNSFVFPSRHQAAAVRARKTRVLYKGNGTLLLLSRGMWVASDGDLSRFSVRARCGNTAEKQEVARQWGEGDLPGVLQSNCPLLCRASTCGPPNPAEAMVMKWSGGSQREVGMEAIDKFCTDLVSLVRPSPGLSIMCSLPRARPMHTHTNTHTRPSTHAQAPTRKRMRTHTHPHTTALVFFQVCRDRSIGIIMFEAFETPGFGCWLPQKVVQTLITLQQEEHITLVADETFNAMFRCGHAPVLALCFALTSSLIGWCY
jgi:hypothetical protein